jgi:hypothetical protein
MFVALFNRVSEPRNKPQSVRYLRNSSRLYAVATITPARSSRLSLSA